MKKNLLTENTGKVFFLLLFAACTLLPGTIKAALTITPATGGTCMNVSPSSYQTLGNILLQESVANAFALSQTNVTLILTAPAGFEFNVGVGSVTFTLSQNITAATVAVTSSTITVTYTTNSTVNKFSDAITIIGIQARATGYNSGPANILRTVGNPGTATITGITNGTTNFGTLTGRPQAVAGTSQTMCAGGPGISLGAAAVGGNTYSWSPITGLSNAAISNPTATPASTTTYTLTETHSGCVATNNVTVTVASNVAPPALTIVANSYDNTGNPVPILGNAATICQFQTVDFAICGPSTTPGCGIYESVYSKTFEWKINGVTVSTQTGTSPFPIIYSTGALATGNVVTLKITWAGPPPCYSPMTVTSQAITFTVTPNQPPTAVLSYSTDTICRGSTVTITANAAEAGATPSYQWYQNGAPIGTNSPTYTTSAALLAGPYSYYCQVTSSDGCDSEEPILNPIVLTDTLDLVIEPCIYYVPLTGALGPFYTCGGPFYDSPNDPSVNYTGSRDGLVTFCPPLPNVPAQYVTLSFTSMSLFDNGDRLRIWAGTDTTTNPTPLTTFTGLISSIPACGSVVISNASSGCLTARFISSSSGFAAGWVASLSCSPTPAPGPLAGSTCANPTIISALPYNAIGQTTNCYGNDYATTTCLTNYNGDDRVYKYVATGPECTSITISGASGSPVLAVYQGCPDVGGICITPVPLSGNTTAQVTFPSAGTYYIIVDELSAFSGYNLNIQSFGLAPINDVACNAQYIDLLVNVNGNNTCTSSLSEPVSPGCWTGGTMNTSWYSFYAPASGAVRIRTTSGTIGSTQIALYSLTGSCGTPANFTLIACNQAGPSCASGGTFSSSEIAWSGLTPGGPGPPAFGPLYYIRVDGRNSTTGNYNIIVVDQTGPQPYADGQDCMAPMTVCNSTFSVGNPGFLETGWVCDYSSNTSCMAAGERSSAWYVINISANGTFSFALDPIGSTDYDWVLMDITGMTMAAACAQISTGNLPWVRCNWSAPQFTTCGADQYVTGMCSNYANASAGGGGPNFSSVYPVTAGMTLLLNLSNFTQNATGFTLNFNNNANTSPVAYANPPSVLYWTAGANNTDWFNPVNWGNCGPPSCNTSAVITTGSVFMPVINTNSDPSGLAVCRDLDIKAGASVTINAGIELDICRNFLNNGSLIAAPTSVVNLINGATQYFDGNMIGSSAFGNIKMSKTLASNMTLLDNAQMTGTLTLANANTGGKIITNNLISPKKELHITNSAPGASNFGSPTSYVQGDLRRNLNGAAGTYYFPVGYASPIGWQLAKIDFTGAHTIPNLVSFFTPWSALPAAGPVSLECPANDYSTLAPLNNGYWTTTASANAGSSTYNMTLFNTNYSNQASANAWTVIKAPTIAGPWVLEGSCNGTSSLTQTRRDAMTSFSVFATGQSGSPLPVELLNFDAVAQGTGVLNTWVTASEINNDYFVIERSRDGEHFEEVGTRKGAGNSTVTNTYSLFDKEPWSGVSYYRLRQIDFDGTTNPSRTVAVNFSWGDNALTVYPNPAESIINYEFGSVADGVVSFEIIDILGKIIYTREIHVVKGLNTFTESISTMPQGVYFIQVKPSGSEIIEPMQKRFVKRMREE